MGSLDRADLLHCTSVAYTQANSTVCLQELSVEELQLEALASSESRPSHAFPGQPA